MTWETSHSLPLCSRSEVGPDGRIIIDCLSLSSFSEAFWTRKHACVVLGDQSVQVTGLLARREIGCLAEC